MGFEVLSESQKKEILTDLKDRWILLHRKRIRDQKEVEGGSFPYLRLKTIIKKQGMGSSVSHNAFNRMIRTGDFMKNAFEGKVTSNSLTFFISPKVYSLKKIAAKRKSYETRKAKGVKVRKPKASYTGKNGMVTYQDIAMYNLRGKFQTAWKSLNNAGADFFGLSKKEADESFKYLKRKAASNAKKNIENELNNIIANARR